MGRAKGKAGRRVAGAAKKKGLPPELVGRARALAEEKRERMIADGRAALARVRERKADIAGAFWDIGDDLQVLEAPGMAKELGHADLYELCWAEAGFAAELVDELLKVRKQLTRAQAIRLGTHSRAAAFLRLAAATPADDTAIELFERGVTTPQGERLPPRAGVRAAKRAAKEFRQARPKKTRRGSTTTAEERAVGARIQRALKKAGAHATVEVVANRPGQPSKLRIEILVTETAALKRAL